MDLYEQLASDELNTPVEEITPEQRHLIKQKMFSNLYGQPYPLNGELNFTFDFSNLYGMTTEEKWKTLEKEFEKHCKEGYVTAEEVEQWVGQQGQE